MIQLPTAVQDDGGLQGLLNCVHGLPIRDGDGVAIGSELYSGMLWEGLGFPGGSGK